MALFTAIAALVAPIFGGLFTAAAFSQFLVNTFAKVAISFLLKAINGGGKKSGPAPFSIQGSLQAGEEVPRGAPFGKCPTAGSLVYANEWGTVGATPNAYFTQVIALSDMPVKGLLRVMINGAWVTLLTAEANSRGAPVQEFRSAGADYLWVKFYDGTQVAADPFLVGSVGSAARPYQATRIGTGCAYAICTSRINSDLFSGFPAFRFELDSMRMYDPSRDSSVGGVGAQRHDNPATWGGDGDDLPVVQVYNIYRGLYFNGLWQYGFQGVSAGRLPVDDWIREINACRVQVQVSGSGVEPKYRSGGFLTFDSECGNAIETIMAACAGRIADTGGIYKPMVGGVGAPVVSIYDGDLLSNEDSPFSPIKGLAETVNAVIAQYPEPANGYNLTDAPAIYRADLEIVDGNRQLPTKVTLANVPYGHQVQRLMTLVMEEARRTRQHTIPLPPWFWHLEPNDTIEWTSARHGYVAKQFRINVVVDRQDASVLVDVIEVDPADYDFDYLNYTIGTPANSIMSFPAAQSVPGWAVAPGTIPDSSGASRRPALQLSWDPVGLDDVQGINYEVRVVSNGTLIHRGTTANVAAGVVLVSSGILGDTEYEARAILVANRFTQWTAWVRTTSPGVFITNSDFQTGIYDLFKAQGLYAIRDVFTLPVSGDFIGEKVYNRFDGIIYQWDGAVWLKLIADVADGSITTGKIAANSITGGLIAASGVITSSAQIDDAVITNAKIGNLAVDTLKIADNAVTVPFSASAAGRTVSLSYIDPTGGLGCFVQVLAVASGFQKRAGVNRLIVTITYPNFGNPINVILAITDENGNGATPLPKSGMVAMGTVVLAGDATITLSCTTLTAGNPVVDSVSLIVMGVRK